MEMTNPSPPAAQRPSRTFILPRLLGLLLTTAIAAGCHHEDAQTESPAPKVDGEIITFQTNSPQLASLNVQPVQHASAAVKHLTGHLYWNDDATVRIFTPVAGRVVRLRADLGESIALDDPLAEIDSPDFGQALANARAASANLAVADKAYARTQDLLTHGAAAEKDVEAAQAAYTAAQAERDRAYAVLANYGGSDKSTNSIYLLRSPLAGVLVEKNINPGQEVRADQMLANATQLYAPLFVVSDPTKLWIQLDVSELDLGSLQVGQHLRIHSPAFPDKIFDGELQNIGPALDPNTRTVKVRGVVANPDKLLRSEMYVMAEVGLSPADGTGMAIPALAVFMQNNHHYVFIEQTAGQFQRRLVKIGAEQDGQVPVLEGVEAGQKVVTDGCLLLQSLLESTD